MKNNHIEIIKNKNLIKYLPDVNMSDRDKEIVSLYLTENTTYQAIGDKYNISRERARQIVIKYSKRAMYFYKKQKVTPTQQ